MNSDLSAMIDTCILVDGLSATAESLAKDIANRSDDFRYDFIQAMQREAAQADYSAGDTSASDMNASAELVENSAMSVMSASQNIMASAGAVRGAAGEIFSVLKGSVVADTDEEKKAFAKKLGRLDISRLRNTMRELKVVTGESKETFSKSYNTISESAEYLGTRAKTVHSILDDAKTQFRPDKLMSIQNAVLALEVIYKIIEDSNNQKKVSV